MRWFSIKKYTPLIGGEYFVTDGDFVYVAEFSTNEKWLDTSNLDVGGRIELGNITHFCIPDPIEREAGEF
jgi:hypothetical protein